MQLPIIYSKGTPGYNEERTYYEVAKYTGNSIEWIAYKYMVFSSIQYNNIHDHICLSFISDHLSDQVPWAVLKVFHQIPLQLLALWRYLLGRR